MSGSAIGQILTVIQATLCHNLRSCDNHGPDLLTAARHAVERHAWQEALDLFLQAESEEELSGPDLEAVAESAFFAGKADLAIDAKERAFKVYLAGSDRVRAAYLAIDLCREYMYKGQSSIGQAWLRRAERLLETEAEGLCPWLPRFSSNWKPPRSS